ncbi:MAG: hypothetical protein MRJ96_01400 [Nitrospirales bacterium]|nr:hypothetical protein [Nitrospira sp.]MDR4500098.1 hypothetical protein [Nitrospirales bacterium]
MSEKILEPAAPATEKVQEQGVLFEYALKCLLLSAFLELVLYRLVSRLGMHLSKLAEKYEAVRIAFRGLSSLGFMLLNVTSILAFLLIFILMYYKMTSTVWKGSYDKIVIPLMSLLVVVTFAYLLFPPAMLGAVVYNIISLVLLVFLMLEYFASHKLRTQRLAIGCFFLGICGWIYYQTLTTSYGLLGFVTAPPLVHEINRLGEALMVASSILVFWAYGSTSFFTKNKQQRKWGLTLVTSGGVVFFLLLFMDYFVSLYSLKAAEDIRKAGEGIGWVFQMGMGYTFYLPFAFYMAGFICWAYTVIKLVMIGRLAGYGLGLMFMAGYALQLSHLTLMVMLGLMLLTIDKRGTLGKLRGKVSEKMIYQPATPAYGPTP